MNNPYVAALDFLIDAGVTVALSDEPNNRFNKKPSVETVKTPQKSKTLSVVHPPEAHQLQNHGDIIQKAENLAKSANTLDELKSALVGFDGLSLKKTATQIVYADGNTDAKIMVIGEAPGADEDRQGIPFVGASGQLLDTIFSCIDLSRADTLYISNILNWRPPGNRTPTPEEMAISAPFIKRHIELINPDILVLCGGVAAKTLLNSKESISRLRGKIHDYNDTTKAIATYHPAFLLRTPLQKKKVWADMLMLRDFLNV